MSFSEKLRVSVILLLSIGSLALAGKSNSGKVTDRLGEAKLQKSTKVGDWTDISIGNKIREKDQIRTNVESYVTIALPDGSSITVQENSLVQFATLEAEDGVQMALTDVKTGKVKFDVQKQHTKSAFKFKSATAVAAIRGTDGFFGSTASGKTFMSLRTGNALLENSSGKKGEVNGGQTIFAHGEGFDTFDAKSSGDENFIKELEKILDDKSIKPEEILDALKKADEAIQSEKEKAASAVSCTFEELSDTITVNKITIKGTCTAGATLAMAGKIITTTDQPFEIDADWAPSAEGPKKFPATCATAIEFPCDKAENDKEPQKCTKLVSSQCGELLTYYKNTMAADSLLASDSQNAVPPFAVSTASPYKVCESGSVTIEGTFDQTDPEGSLIVKMGNGYVSKNLVPISAGGHFSHTISISDINSNWDEKKVTVEYKGKSGNSSAAIDLNVDKTCKEVNRTAPKISFSGSDSIRCVANFSLTGASNDIVVVTRKIDGTVIKENSYTRNNIIPTKLNSGIHEYEFIAEDQAGNTSTFKKTLGCYPNTSVKISVSGGLSERLRVPPNTPHSKDNHIYKTLHFKINGLPQQDPRHIKRITVTQDGQTLLNYSNDQIERNDFDVQVKLNREVNSEVKISVEMKNGKKLSAVKTYILKSKGSH